MGNMPTRLFPILYQIGPTNLILDQSYSYQPKSLRNNATPNLLNALKKWLLLQSHNILCKPAHRHKV